MRLSRRTTLSLLGATVAGATGGFGTGAASSHAESWRQDGYSAQNTGHAPDNTGPRAATGRRWRFDPGPSVYGHTVVADGTVVVTTREPVGLYALDASDGTVRWQHTPPSEQRLSIWGAPSVVDGTVYALESGGDGGVRALDLADGSEQWYASLTRPTSVTVADRTAFVGTGDRVTALDTADGSTRWESEVFASVRSVPAVADGRVYAAGYRSGRYTDSGDSRGVLHAFDATDGTERWSFEGRAMDNVSVVDGTLYVTAHELGEEYAPDYQRLYALDPTDGAVTASRDLDGLRIGYAATPDRLFLSTFDVPEDEDRTGTPRIRALATDGLTEEWTFEGPLVGEYLAVPAVADGTVYTGGGSRRILGLDAADGSMLWEFDACQGPYSQPAVADGTVYICGWIGGTYALEEGGASPSGCRPQTTPDQTTVGGGPGGNGTTADRSGDDSLPWIPLAGGTLAVLALLAGAWTRRSDDDSGAGATATSEESPTVQIRNETGETVECRVGCFRDGESVLDRRGTVEAGRVDTVGTVPREGPFDLRVAVSGGRQTSHEFPDGRAVPPTVEVVVAPDRLDVTTPPDE